MKPGSWFALGAILAGLAVANGAFAAHGLQARLAPIYEDQPEVFANRLAQYETGVRYQMYHAFALMLLGVAAARRATALWSLAGLSFVAGILFFSGMLYLLVFTNQPKLGMIVPIGGLAYILGWVALAAGGYGAFREPPTV
jgi:uncharacterized membrane protein YgdD (TMEM256/DUF423 family)